MDDEGAQYIRIKAETKEAYYKILDELSKFNQSAITISGTSKNQETIIIEKDSPEDSEESNED